MDEMCLETEMSYSSTISYYRRQIVLDDLFRACHSVTLSKERKRNEHCTLSKGYYNKTNEITMLVFYYTLTIQFLLQ